MRSFLSTKFLGVIAVTLAIFLFQNCAVPKAFNSKSFEKSFDDDACKGCDNNDSSGDSWIIGGNGGNEGNGDSAKKIKLTVQQNKLCYEQTNLSIVKSVYKKSIDNSFPSPALSFGELSSNSIKLASATLYYGLRNRKSGELVQCHKFEQSAEGRILEIEKSKMSLEFDNISNFDHNQYTIDIIQNDCKSGDIVASSGALTSNGKFSTLPGLIIIQKSNESDKDSSDYIMTTRLIAAKNTGDLSKDKCIRDGEYESPECACDEKHDPLIIDLSGQGLKLSSLAGGPVFDIQGIDQLSRVGWTEYGSEMAFVVNDLNKNGVIDGGHEMFGDATRIPSGLTAANGFEALYAFDGNRDLIIDAKDSIFRNLKLWTDFNHNGDTEYGELVPLSDKVKAIKLKYKVVNRDINGNKIYAESSAILNDSREVLAADVWFASVIVPLW